MRSLRKNRIFMGQSASIFERGPLQYLSANKVITLSNMTLSETLRKAVLASKKTRYAIAIGAGIDHAVLRRFMRKERDIKLSTAEHLADYLELELSKRRKKKR